MISIVYIYRIVEPHEKTGVLLHRTLSYNSHLSAVVNPSHGGRCREFQVYVCILILH